MSDVDLREMPILGSWVNKPWQEKEPEGLGKWEDDSSRSPRVVDEEGRCGEGSPPRNTHDATRPTHLLCDRADNFALKVR
jgi:hypothetical protein